MIKTCESCGEKFHTVRAKVRYCSRACVNAAWRCQADERAEARKITMTCLNGKCGKKFSYDPNRSKRVRKYCCPECRVQHAREERHHAWKGGEVPDVRNGTIRQYTGIRNSKNGRGLYRAKHRLLIEEYLGRSLERHEMVIHLNRDHTDNRLKNLYLCSTRGEMTRILWGTLPFPEKSNLDDLKVAEAEVASAVSES